ncbi:adenosine kinase [Wuchereria bancrofti]|uniref:Adenosine kinase n=1 Tax=Wuchereria bancrofti TaxID=6293 RepID=J9ENK9_WUCBA|nr:adenosine kinase [Wuchereria bancrofti]
MQCTRNFPRCPEGVILGCGNPLLDMRVEVSLDFLKRFQELLDNYDISYTPGGTTQNSLRVCQVNNLLQFEKFAMDIKCAESFSAFWLHRSLCAHLAAANLFTIDHLEKPESRVLIETAQYFYISGFFLTVCPAAVMSIAQHASKHSKVFATNLAAPFVLKYFRDEFLGVLPYVDILFGNERESKAFADANNYNTHELQQINMR